MPCDRNICRYGFTHVHETHLPAVNVHVKSGGGENPDCPGCCGQESHGMTTPDSRLIWYTEFSSNGVSKVMKRVFPSVLTRGEEETSIDSSRLRSGKICSR